MVLQIQKFVYKKMEVCCCTKIYVLRCMEFALFCVVVFVFHFCHVDVLSIYKNVICGIGFIFQLFIRLAECFVNHFITILKTIFSRFIYLAL